MLCVLFCFVVMFRYHRKMRDPNLAIFTLPVLFYVNASVACDWLLPTTGLHAAGYSSVTVIASAADD